MLHTTARLPVSMVVQPSRRLREVTREAAAHASGWRPLGQATTMAAMAATMVVILVTMAATIEVVLLVAMVAVMATVVSAVRACAIGWS